MKNLLFVLLLSSFSAEALEDEVFQLSLEELLTVDISKSPARKIFYSEKQPPSENSINIGLIVPFGVYRQYSSELIAAAELAASSINSKGGVFGRPVSVIIGDNNANLEYSISLAEEMVAKHRVAALITPGSSDHTAQITKRISKIGNVLLFAPASNANMLSQIKDNDWLFRLAPTNQQIGDVLAQFIQNHQLTDIAVIYERDTFGKEIFNHLNHGLLNKKLPVIYSDSMSHLVDYSKIDYKTKINEIQKSGAKTLVLPLRPHLLLNFIAHLFADWQGELPVLLLPEHQFSVPIVNKSKRNICTYAVSPINKIKNASLLQTIDLILKSENSTYTSIFVNDIVHLVALSEIYSHQYHTPANRSLREITLEHSPVFDSANFSQASSFYSKHKQSSFIGISGQIAFDQYGDNLGTTVSVVPVHHIYGNGCIK